MPSQKRLKFANAKHSDTDHVSDLAEKQHAAYSTLAASIEEKILSHLGEARLEISNESAQHAKHLASEGYLVSHLKIIVVASSFDGISRLNRHKLLNKILAEEFKAVHSITLSLLTPREAQS